MDPEKHPIFVIGTGRSGTTLLRTKLSAHPRIYLTHEAAFYAWEERFDPKRGGEAYLRYFLKTFSFRWLGIDPRPILDALPKPFDMGQTHLLYTEVMRQAAQKYGKVRFGDKSPYHSSHAGQILRDYPQAKIVRIIRDPRNVVKSFARMPWAPANPIVGANLCKMVQNQTRPYNDKIYNVKLEDILAKPKETMAGVLDFVGEPWDDAVLDHHLHPIEPDDMPPMPWFQSAKKAATPFRPPDHSDLHPADLRLVEQICQETMKAHGYDPYPLPEGSEPSTWAKWMRRIQAWPDVARGIRQVVGISRLAKDEANFDNGASDEIFYKINAPAWDLYPGYTMPDPPPLPDGWDRRFTGLA